MISTDGPLEHGLRQGHGLALFLSYTVPSLPVIVVIGSSGVIERMLKIEREGVYRHPETASLGSRARLHRLNK